MKREWEGGREERRKGGRERRRKGGRGREREGMEAREGGVCVTQILQLQRESGPFSIT